MANQATLYRFRLDVSDIDRGFYGALDNRVAMHPSETIPFLVTRVLAFALCYDEGLEFSKGLSTVDEPAIWKKDPGGQILIWIEIGSPSAERLHKAAKASRQVLVFTHKDPENLAREVAGKAVHRASEIEVVPLDRKFLDELGVRLAKDNRWSVIHQEGSLTVSIGDQSFMTTLARRRLS